MEKDKFKTRFICYYSNDDGTSTNETRLELSMILNWQYKD